MMLSIIIPTYNCDARALVAALQLLATRECVEAELLVGDDASTAPMTWLREVEALPQVRVLRYGRNAGRAAHRNRLAAAAQGAWLLFIDCDARVDAAFSLRRYLAATAAAPVVCGGLLTPDVNPCPEATLRYRYERAADRRRRAADRRRQPYAHLSTFSLLVRRDLFLGIRFDEACREYGYEDALFGVELKRRGIAICHIDNPLLHTGMEPNDVYLRKTETALHTLLRLDGRMQGFSHVETVADTLQRLHLAGAVRLLYCMFKGGLRRNLLGARPSLTIFSFYKLGYFLSLRHARMRC